MFGEARMHLFMRSSWILILFVLALAAGVATYLCHAPTVDSRFIDMVSASMQGIGKVVPPGSRIGVRRYTNFIMINPINHYALATEHISLFEHNRLDTLLIITSAVPSDSVLHEALNGRKVLWQNKDSMYRYYVTCSK